ncbi:MAG: acylphosphatase [Candidatus Bathyarchaeia archaeon]
MTSSRRGDLEERKVRVRLFISGIVQGVFYRAETRGMALRLGVKGWVRNLPDGRVEALLEGDRERVEQLVQWCRRGPEGAVVRKVEVSQEPYRGDLTSFEAR